VVELALTKLEVVLAFPFPFCVAERLAGVVIMEVKSVVFTAVDVCISR